MGSIKLSGGKAGAASLTEGIELPIDSVVQGENILSVYNGQGGFNSLDVLWGCRLTATYVGKREPPLPPPPLEDVSVDEYDSVRLYFPAIWPGVQFQWFKDGVELFGRTDPELIITRAVPSDSGSYTVRMTNHYGSLISNSAAVTVFPDETKPLIESAVGGVELTNVFVNRNSVGVVGPLSGGCRPIHGGCDAQ